MNNLPDEILQTIVDYSGSVGFLSWFKRVRGIFTRNLVFHKQVAMPLISYNFIDDSVTTIDEGFVIFPMKRGFYTISRTTSDTDEQYLTLYGAHAKAQFNGFTCIYNTGKSIHICYDIFTVLLKDYRDIIDAIFFIHKLCRLYGIESSVMFVTSNPKYPEFICHRNDKIYLTQLDARYIIPPKNYNDIGIEHFNLDS